MWPGRYGFLPRGLVSCLCVDECRKVTPTHRVGSCATELCASHHSQSVMFKLCFLTFAEECSCIEISKPVTWSIINYKEATRNVWNPVQISVHSTINMLYKHKSYIAVGMYVCRSCSCLFVHIPCNFQWSGCMMIYLRHMQKSLRMSPCQLNKCWIPWFCNLIALIRT